jgi:long-chain acyl-CoA synthetase
MTPLTREQAIAAATAPGQPHELVDEVVDGHRLRVFKSAPPTLRALFESTASDLPFISYQDERLTYAQAWRAAARIGQVLVQQCGVQKGDRVAISMRNYPEWVLGFTAATSVGAIAVAMNGHWQAEELAYALADSGAKVLLADQERLDRWAAGPATPGLQVLAVRATTLPDGVRSLQALVDAVADPDTGADADVPMPPVALLPDDLAIMLYTSGSTGHPKGVPSSHRNVITALMSWELDGVIAALTAGVEIVPPAEQPGTLLAVPLFHVTGLHASCLAGYRAQRRMVCMYRWDPEAAARLVDRDRLTSLIAPSAMTGDMVRVAQAGGHDLSSLLVLGGGGAPRPPEQVRQIKASFANALPNIGWGMTETNAIGAGVGGEDYLARPSSSGRCSQVLQLRVVDELGEPLPAGQPGELLVRGTSVFKGYWNRPDTNQQAFIGDWFRTGDVATIDGEGFVTIVDRIKDLIIRGGENIGCGQVEAALLMHPDVQEAAVYAVPDERLGEEVGATVYGNPALDVAALREFLTEHLARFEIPRYITVAEGPLPRTPSGKILKREIKTAALALMPKAPPQVLPQAPPQAGRPDGPSAGPAAA